jgi:fumarylacetoacetase
MIEEALAPKDLYTNTVPTRIGDYVDFFSSVHHARNCLKIVLGPDRPLTPNWL